MRVLIVCAWFLGACHEAAAPPPVIPVVLAVPAPVDAGVADAGAPDAEAPVGAMVVPDEDSWTQPPRIDEIDTTVTIDELQAVRGWRKAKRAARGGAVMVVLHVVPEDVLYLSVVEDGTGIRHQYALGPASYRADNHTFDRSAYPSWNHLGDYVGPIVFAIRVRTGDADWRQVAVWADGSTLKVAQREAGGEWRPVVRVRFPRRTTFQGIGTTDPH